MNIKKNKSNSCSNCSNGSSSIFGRMDIVSSGLSWNEEKVLAFSNWPFSTLLFKFCNKKLTRHSRDDQLTYRGCVSPYQFILFLCFVHFYKKFKSSAIIDHNIQHLCIKNNYLGFYPSFARPLLRSNVILPNPSSPAIFHLCMLSTASRGSSRGWGRGPATSAGCSSPRTSSSAGTRRTPWHVHLIIG